MLSDWLSGGSGGSRLCKYCLIKLSSLNHVSRLLQTWCEFTIWIWPGICRCSG
jgi:hypothetical protein